MKYCPYCNNDIVDGRCSNTDSHCDYVGPGVDREPITDKSPKLGDMTGEPRNNGWADGFWGYDEE